MLTSGTGDLVTAIIRVYKDRRFLEESLSSAGNQAGAAVEILVVDGGPEDGSGDIARIGKDVRIIRRKNGELGAALNAGIEEARGKFIAFLDADDIWHPDKTARQLAALKADPKADGVLCRFRNFLDLRYPPPAGLDTRRFLEEKTGSMPSLITLLATRETVARIGPFRSDLASGEDLDWFARAADLGVVFARMPEVLVERRLHDGNLSYHATKDLGFLLEIMRASIERKRASGRDGRQDGMKTDASRRKEGPEERD